MRTWTLAKDKRYWTMMRVHDCTAFPKDDEEFVRAIELEPVLDLLARHLPADGKPRCAVDRETVALLRTHGRLDG